MALKHRVEITRELMEDLFIIEDGSLHWRLSRGRANAGDRCGWVDQAGYRYIGVSGRLFQEHRLLFFYFKGYMPDLVDHEDRDTSNNFIANLRVADKVLNSVNRDLQSNNTSGVRGVGWNKNAGKWVAYIKHHGKHLHLGLFDLFEDAVAVRLKAQQELWNA